MKIWERLQQKLPSLIQHPIEPVLVHGDLWSANLIYSHKPVFIDPAIYFADPFIDIAYTKLFGGFEQKFYDAYLEVYPIVPEVFELEKLYQIYSLLVHTILFGGKLLQLGVIQRNILCMNNKNILYLYTDGCSKGNPGESGIGGLAHAGHHTNTHHPGYRRISRKVLFSI